MTKGILQSLVAIILIASVAACSERAATERESVADGLQASERPVPDAISDGSPDVAGSELAGSY